MARRNYTLLGVQVGDKFGMLTVIKKTVLKKRGSYLWECLCDCGNHHLVTSSSLTSSNTTSCGCFGRETKRNNIARVIAENSFEGTQLYQLNQKVRSTNSSGVKGVNFHCNSGRWRAYIVLNRKFKHLGYFENMESAIQARRDAELKYYAPILHKHGLELKPQEISESLMKDDMHKRKPFYDFGKGIKQD